MINKKKLNAKSIVPVVILLVLWTGLIFSVVNLTLIKLENLATVSGVVSSVNVVRGSGRGSYYYVQLGIARASGKFDVGNFGEKFFAQQVAQELKSGDKVKLYLSSNSEVYQLESAHKVLYAFADAKQEDKTAAIGLAFLVIFFTIFWGYIILRVQSANSAV
ncbi:MAG: hypothetical protein ACRYFX_05510 [Janthinobacterium lividum]